MHSDSLNALCVLIKVMSCDNDKHDTVTGQSENTKTTCRQQRRAFLKQSSYSDALPHQQLRTIIF